MSSEARDEEEVALEIAEPKHQQWHGLEEILKLEFMTLVRIRDFLSLILTYSMTLPDQHLLERWRDDARVLTTKYYEHIDCVGGKASGAYHWMHLLSEKPLKNMEVLIPNDILSKIEDGHRSIFNDNAAILSGEAVASASTNKGKKVLELANVHNVIPEAILNLAADLAVDQLIQTLLTCNIHHVMFSTRSGVEKMDVMRKIKAVLNDEHNGTAISDKYSRVLWVDASKYSSNTEVWVQREIAQQLDLMTRKGDQTEHNDILLTRLIEVEMMRMNHLVFLVDGDDNRNVDPRKVGFPKKTLSGVVVLLTIQSSVLEHDELTMAMDLEIRTEDHMMPWELFCRNLGRELVPSSSDIQRIAVQIVEECRGHLLAIVLVARSLKNMEDVQLWKCALRKLRYLHPVSANRIPDNMNKAMVNAFTNITLNNLNETEKLCLACTLYVLRLGEKMADHLLISSWMHNKVVCSQEEAERILSDFVHCCIFLQLERKYIRWPEEIYDVLKSLLLLYPLDTIKKGGLGLTELPTTGEWLSARHIELMNNKLSELPPTLACPELTRLLLQGNTNLIEIPPLFFSLMPHLRVLDLSYTSIRSLPSSIFNLEELSELRLRGCKRFMELPIEIGQLKNLEILDLDSTPITYIPEQIQELTKLETLILSFYACHDMMKNLQYPVPPGVISKLIHLHHLCINVRPVNKCWDENIQVILPEISELQNLITLSLYIPQVKLLKHIPQRLDFRFIVGHHIQQRIISHAPPSVEAKFKQTKRSLRFVNGVNVSNDIFKVLRHSEALFLERHRTIKNLSQIDIGSLVHLQSFIVGECNEMQTLIDGGCSYRPDLCWTFLCVFYMNNLRSICEVEAYFHSLKTIALHNCPKLTIIFTLNYLDSLVNLEELIVEDCPKVSTLISLESFESKEGIFLPHLRKVSLLYLPDLASIWSGLCIGPSLQRIGFYDCPKLQTLSTNDLWSQNLKVIKGEKAWWDALQWGKESRPDYLQDRFSPIDEETDIFDQLLEDEESSRSNKREDWVEDLVGKAEILFTLNDEAEKIDLLVRDNVESSASNEETREAEITESVVRDDDESFRSNKKETSEAEVMELAVRDDESSRSNKKETSVRHFSFRQKLKKLFLKSKDALVGDKDKSSGSNKLKNFLSEVPERMDSLARDDDESSKSHEKQNLISIGAMGSHMSKKIPATSFAVNFNTDMLHTTELSSYEAACKLDADLQSFDATLQARIYQVINTLARGVAVRALSFNSLKQVMGCLLEMNQEVVKVILEDKKDIWNCREVFELVEEYFENSVQTLDFCASLEKCLKRARDSQLLILVTIKQFEEEAELGDYCFVNSLQELKNFKAAGDPFTEEFFQIFQSAYKQQMLMLEKLQLRIRKNRRDKKLTCIRTWRKVTSMIFVVTFVGVLIYSVVAAAVADPPVASALAAATSIPIGSMGKWINSLWKKYEKALKGQKEVISSMPADVRIRDLDDIRFLIDMLEIQIVSKLQNMEIPFDEEAAKIVMAEIKKQLGVFMENFEDLGVQVDMFSRKFRMARTVVLQRIIKHPHK